MAIPAINPTFTIEPPDQPVPQATIGPQKTWGDIFSQSADAPVISQALDKLSQLANFTPKGQQEHPVQAAAGQFASRLKQMLFGGQGGGVNMETGFVNNPVTGMLLTPEGATAALERGGEAVSEAIPSTARATKTFEELRGSLGTHTVAMTDRLKDSLDAIKEAADTGSTLPSVVNKFVTRIADIDKGPLTYNEARSFYSNISDLSASERMAAKAKDLRLINEFKHSLGEAIGNTAADAGRLQDYQGAMSEYARSKQMRERAVKVGRVALKTAGAATGGGIVLEGYKRLSDAMGW